MKPQHLTLQTLAMSPSDNGAVEFFDDLTNPFHFNGIQKQGVLYQTLINQCERVFGGKAGWGYTSDAQRRLYHKLVEYVTAEKTKLNELESFITSTGVSGVAEVEDENWDILARAALAEHRVRQILGCVEGKTGEEVDRMDVEECVFDDERYETTHVWRQVVDDLRKLREGNGDFRETMEEIMGKGTKDD